MTSRVIATCFAVCAFAAALFVGVLADNTFLVIIQRALVVMVVCYPIGRIVGALATRSVDDHIRDYKERNPMPGELNSDNQDQPAGVTSPGTAS